MTDTAKKILRLLQPDQPLDVRCAAALVLGELGKGKMRALTPQEVAALGGANR